MSRPLPGALRRLVVALPLAAPLLASASHADAPSVAVDIAPVHALVAQVMAGVGAPDLVIPPGASPHEHTLRPSEAAALQEADLVFWIGPDLTPWLEDSIETLAADATVTALLGAGGSSELPFREGATFGSDDHGHGHDDHDKEHGHDEHAHDDHGHDEHGHDEHAHDDHGHDEHGHDDHAHDDHGHDKHGHADGHGHVHGEHDPHAWLSPENAVLWLDLIATELGKADPGNADAYAANAASAQAELRALTDEIDAMLSPLRGRPFVVFHDAYQYFEVAFDMPSAGAIKIGDASDPSPARIAEIQALVSDNGIACVLAEPQFNPQIVATVAEGTPARTAVIDPLGASLTPGPTLYGEMLGALATSLAACLK